MCQTRAVLMAHELGRARDGVRSVKKKKKVPMAMAHVRGQFRAVDSQTLTSGISRFSLDRNEAAVRALRGMLRKITRHLEAKSSSAMRDSVLVCAPCWCNGNVPVSE